MVKTRTTSSSPLSNVTNVSDAKSSSVVVAPPIAARNGLSHVSLQPPRLLSTSRPFLVDFKMRRLLTIFEDVSEFVNRYLDSLPIVDAARLRAALSSLPPL